MAYKKKQKYSLGGWIKEKDSGLEGYVKDLFKGATNATRSLGASLSGEEFVPKYGKDDFNSKAGAVTAGLATGYTNALGKIAPMALDTLAPGTGQLAKGVGSAVYDPNSLSSNAADNATQASEDMQYQQDLLMRRSQGMLNNNTNNQSIFAYGGKIKDSYALGGNIFNDITDYKGNKHEQGGISLNDYIEVEDGETRGQGTTKDFIFSDRIKFNDKTFAETSKVYSDKYKNQPNDSLTAFAKNRELNNLALAQELFKANEGVKGYTNGVKKMYGGGFFNPDIPPYSNSSYFNNNVETQLLSGNPIQDPNANSLDSILTRQLPNAVVPQKASYSIPEPYSVSKYANDANEIALLGNNNLMDNNANTLTSILNKPLSNTKVAQNSNPYKGTTTFGSPVMSIFGNLNAQNSNLPLLDNSTLGTQNEIIKDKGATTVSKLLTEKKVNTKDNGNGSADYSSTPSIDAIGIGLSAIPNIIAGFRTNKLKKNINYGQVGANTVTPELMDPTRTVQDANTGFNRSQGYLRQGGLGKGAYLSNALANETNRSTAISDIYSKYGNMNADISNRAQEFNANQVAQTDRVNVDLRAKEIQDRTGIEQNAIALQSQGLNNAMQAYFADKNYRNNAPFLGGPNVETTYGKNWYGLGYNKPNIKYSRGNYNTMDNGDIVEPDGKGGYKVVGNVKNNKK